MRPTKLISCHPKVLFHVYYTTLCVFLHFHTRRLTNLLFVHELLMGTLETLFDNLEVPLSNEIEII